MFEQRFEVKQGVSLDILLVNFDFDVVVKRNTDMLLVSRLHTLSVVPSVSYFNFWLHFSLFNVLFGINFLQNIKFSLLVNLSWPYWFSDSLIGTLNLF